MTENSSTFILESLYCVTTLSKALTIAWENLEGHIAFTVDQHSLSISKPLWADNLPLCDRVGLDSRCSIAQQPPFCSGGGQLSEALLNWNLMVWSLTGSAGRPHNFVRLHLSLLIPVTWFWMNEDHLSPGRAWPINFAKEYHQGVTKETHSSSNSKSME